MYTPIKSVSTVSGYIWFLMKNWPLWNTRLPCPIHSHHSSGIRLVGYHVHCFQPLDILIEIIQLIISKSVLFCQLRDWWRRVIIPCFLLFNHQHHIQQIFLLWKTFVGHWKQNDETNEMKIVTFVLAVWF